MLNMENITPAVVLLKIYEGFIFKSVVKQCDQQANLFVVTSTITIMRRSLNSLVRLPVFQWYAVRYALCLEIPELPSSIL